MAVGYGLVGLYHGSELQLIVTSCIADVGAGIVVAGAPALVVGVVSRDEQGLGSGMLNMLISLFGALVAAGVYAILAADSTVVDGTAFSLDRGFTWIFWLGSLETVAALALSLFIPRPLSRRARSGDADRIGRGELHRGFGTAVSTGRCREGGAAGWSGGFDEGADRLERGDFVGGRGGVGDDGVQKAGRGHVGVCGVAEFAAVGGDDHAAGRRDTRLLHGGVVEVVGRQTVCRAQSAAADDRRVEAQGGQGGERERTGQGSFGGAGRPPGTIRVARPGVSPSRWMA